MMMTNIKEDSENDDETIQRLRILGGFIFPWRPASVIVVWYHCSMFRLLPGLLPGGHLVADAARIRVSRMSPTDAISTARFCLPCHPVMLSSALRCSSTLCQERSGPILMMSRTIACVSNGLYGSLQAFTSLCKPLQALRAVCRHLQRQSANYCDVGWRSFALLAICSN